MRDVRQAFKAYPPKVVGGLLLLGVMEIVALRRSRARVRSALAEA
ncbi:hypothetical protein [Flagellatimonas centrodinii]|nr:hypothetical protein [Flagellatimonas centrodinii]